MCRAGPGKWLSSSSCQITAPHLCPHEATIYGRQAGREVTSAVWGFWDYLGELGLTSHGGWCGGMTGMVDCRSHGVVCGNRCGLLGKVLRAAGEA